MEQDLPLLAHAFGLEGRYGKALRWGSGHIHETWRVETETQGSTRYTLLQRINTEVFRDPQQLTETIRRVTAHLRRKLAARGVFDLERGVLTLLEARDGHVCHRHEDGSWWRAYAFIDQARSFDQAASPEMARRAAFAFGAFQRELSDLPSPRLPETIPHFHDTPRRLVALEDAVRQDELGRVAAARPEIEFALSRRDMERVLLDAHEAGKVPERVTHNDTKINNVLFDEESGEALCVIDLDTVMPGLGPYDFGDLVRTSTSPAPEDERDLDRIHADPALFKAVADGYLEAMGDLLTDAERDLLPFSGRLITWQIGIRFLTDHLQGDTYFRTHRAGHNLERARAQFAMLRSLEAQDDVFHKIVSGR